MSNESSKKASSSSSSSPTPSSSSSSAADSYIGSFIRLTSKYEIRYEGVLYFLNPQDSTLGLKNVKCYGTEGRKKYGPQIPPTNKMYECVLFRGSDIKDLQVKSSPSSHTEEPMHNDPAIIQSQYAAGPSISSRSLSVGGSSLTDYSSNQEPLAFSTGPYPNVVPSTQSKTHTGPFGPETTQNACTSGMPRYQQGHNATLSSTPYAPQYPKSSVSAAAPQAVQNHLRAPALQMPVTAAGQSNLLNGLTESLGVHSHLQSPVELSNSLHATAPVSSHVTSSFVHTNIRPTFDPYSKSPANMPSTLSIKASLPSHPAVPTANNNFIPLLPSSSQNPNVVESLIAAKGFNPESMLPVQSLPHAVPLGADFTPGPSLNKPPILVTPGQLSPTRPSALTSTLRPVNGQSELGPMSSISSFSTPAIQAPLFPLPALAKQYQYTPQFTEEFDFEAMNEKFKKEEVWGYLGKSKQKEEIEGIEDDLAGQSLGNGEVHGVALNIGSKPAYNKDEFFDTISCNSLARGSRNVQSRFSGRLRLDTETSGHFQHENHPVYGSHGFGHGENRGPYGWGREYNYNNYGGRGRGGRYMHMRDYASYKD